MPVGCAITAWRPAYQRFMMPGLIEAVAVPQTKVFEAAVLFTRTEGILPAPESSHAIRAAIDEALEAKETGEKKVILFNLSGHGHFDLVSYSKYVDHKLEDYEYPQQVIDSVRQHIPAVQGNVGLR